MPLTDLTNDAIIEKNKLDSKNVEIFFLQVTYEGEIRRVCLNNEDITWNGELWTKAKFSLRGLTETKDSTVPSVSLAFKDLFRVVLPLIEEYDGISGATAWIGIVDSLYLANNTPKAQYSLEVISCSITDQYDVTINLGGENLMNRRCPLNRYLKNHCRYKSFKGNRCQYVGTELTCDRTFTQCDEYDNVENFGGAPGIGSTGLLI
jgi:phage-related protein